MSRVLMLTENYPPGRGGMAQSCDRIVAALRSHGTIVDVAHISPRLRELRVEAQQNGRLLSCPVEDDPAHAINLLWNLLSASDEQPTQIMAFGGVLPLLAGPVFAAWLQCPLIVQLRGNDFDTGIVSLRNGWIVREALMRAACVCVLSRDHQRKVESLYPAASVSWIPNSIDTEHWQLHDFDRQRAQAWRSSTVEPGRRVIGLFGHLKQKKGCTLLLEALKRSGLSQRFHLLLVGDIEPAMEAPLGELAGLTGVTHIPFVDRFDMLPWYAACDLLALPSHYDGMPNVVLEAGALAVPLLASSAGGMDDLLIDGENALTFSPGDVHQCRQALQRAADLTDAALLRLGERLQARILDEFQPRRELEGYLQALRDTASAAIEKPAVEKPILDHALPFAKPNVMETAQ